MAQASGPSGRSGGSGRPSSGKSGGSKPAGGKPAKSGYPKSGKPTTGGKPAKSGYPKSGGGKSTSGGRSSSGPRDERQARAYDDRGPSRPSSSRDDRPARSYDDRPKRTYSDGPSRDTRPARSYDDRGPSRPSSSRDDRPARSYDDRPKRSYDDRGPSRPSSPRDDRPARSYDDRPKRSYDDRGPSRPSTPRDDRPARSYDDRPRRTYSDGPARDDRGGSRGGYAGRGGDSRVGSRGSRPTGGRPAGGRPERRDDRPARPVGPAVPDSVTGEELDKAIRGDLRTLSLEAAEIVSRHLVMVQRLIDDQPTLAWEHAKAAVARGGRLAVVREAAGLAAYSAGQYADALAQLRAARRISGSDDYWPVMADCERGLGRPDRAIKMAGADEVARLDRGGKVEMRIVASGARRDLGQLDAAVVTLQCAELDSASTEPWSARIKFAYADALLAAGRDDEARTWFARALEVDVHDETDAAERLAELDGLVWVDTLDEDDDDAAADDDLEDGLEDDLEDGLDEADEALEEELEDEAAEVVLPADLEAVERDAEGAPSDEVLEVLAAQPDPESELAELLGDDEYEDGDTEA